MFPVTVKAVNLIGTQNGVRIKSWGKPSNGFVRRIIFQNIIMLGVQNPIIIDQNYCLDNIKYPCQASRVKIRDVKYKMIKGTSTTQVAVEFDCNSKHPCNELRLEDVNLTFHEEEAEAQALYKNAIGMSSSWVRHKVASSIKRRLLSTLFGPVSPLSWCLTFQLKYVFRFRLDLDMKCAIF
ncbi:hypothetical protein QN277_010058 [Acacia crassicarpa]|nr:hypothetical protein QN277_010058 [Acacia crassicarpa]